MIGMVATPQPTLTKEAIKTQTDEVDSKVGFRIHVLNSHASACVCLMCS